MTQVFRVMVWVIVATVAVAAESRADEPETARQSPRRPFMMARQAPTMEVGGYIGVWNLMDGGGAAGLRVTRRRADWLAFEGEAHYHGGTVSRSGTGLAQVQARFSASHASRPGLVFAMVGVALGRSIHFRTSPMIGAGYQSAWTGAVAVRGEVQVYLRGRGVDDRGRLLLGLVIGWS